jgi:hypothetical protein
MYPNVDEVHPLMLHEVINFLVIGSIMLWLSQIKGSTSSMTCGAFTSIGHAT